LDQSNEVSAEGRAVRERSCRVWAELREGFEQRNRDTKISLALIEIQLRAAKPNWDGYGARQVNSLSIAYAARFLFQLPSSSPLPTIDVDPDGEVSFDWIGPEEEELTISISGKGVISYSLILGETDHDHGQRLFRGKVPSEIHQKIAAVYQSASPFRWFEANAGPARQ
jgi:hypothetical protein